MLRKSNRKELKFIRLIAVAVLSGTLIISTSFVYSTRTNAADYSDTDLHNPVVEMNTCDTVYFGNYWQEDTNGDGVADQNDEKTPIRWRVLSQDGNDAYVMADQVLDCKSYHETEEEVTWETSDIRTWLNEEFYNTAFSQEEQVAILEQTIENEDDENGVAEEEINVVDKIYPPSADDLTNSNYGFLEYKATGD